MRLPYILMAAISTLVAHQVPVTASVDGAVALPGQSRLLRGNDIAEGVKEERGFADVVDRLMAKILVSKMARTNSFSALEKVDGLAKVDRVLNAADDHMTSVFKFAYDAKMRPDDLATQLKAVPELDDAFRQMAVKSYTNYLAGLGKTK